jgi:hypothetical protein
MHSFYGPGRPILADLDGDGLPEVVFRADVGMPLFPVRVYKNDGGGRFHLLSSLRTDMGTATRSLSTSTATAGPRSCSRCLCIPI